MTVKTKRIINIVTAAVIVTAAILVFSWFNVRGAEFDFLEDLPKDCSATVSIWSWSFDGSNTDHNQYESELTQDQLSQILQLLQSSFYWRDPASSITHNEESTYTIFITYETDGTAQYLSITSSGGYAVLMNSSQDIPFENDFLRIRDKDWVAKLDAILAS